MQSANRIQQFNELNEHQGHTNQPTWALFNWIMNEPNEQAYWLEVALDTYQQAEPSEYLSAYEEAVRDLETFLRESLESSLPEQLQNEASFLSDLITWALAYVDCRDVAESLIDQATEQ